MVRTADDDGARLAVDHLVALGHREIVHIDGGRAPGAADRRRGYRTAMRRHGLTGQVVPGGLTEEDGAAAARACWPTSPADRGRWPSTTSAPPACSTCSSAPASRCPAQVSVVGFDDSHLARLAHVNLTTVGQDIPRLADLAVVRALARLEGQPARRNGNRRRAPPDRPRHHRRPALGNGQETTARAPAGSEQASYVAQRAHRGRYQRGNASPGRPPGETPMKHACHLLHRSEIC